MSSLPDGLFVCPTCGDIRGRTPEGRRSLCYCQGIVCNWCEARFRRPIGDHYSTGSGWLHTPHLAFPAGHRCPRGVERGPGKWYRLLTISDLEPEADREPS